MFAIVGNMSEPAKHLTRLPQELYAAVQETAEKEGISANAFLVAVVAAALGYKLPKGSPVLLALTDREAWAYWHGAGSAADDAEEIVGDDEAAAFRRAHAKLTKALPKK